MRRLRTARAPDRDPAATEGGDRLALEGDPLLPEADEIAALRPFGREIPGALLAAATGPGATGEPEAARIPRQARELAALGRRLDAILLLRRHLEDEPAAAEVRLLLARLLEDGGDPDAAREELDRALTAMADPVPGLVQRGALLARGGRGAEAERDLREALRLAPAHAEAHHHLGVALLRRGRAADAAASFRAALALRPDDAEGHYYLGEALQSLGSLEAALDALQRAAALDPAHPRSYKLMGRLLDRLGRTEDARAMHRRAREAGIR